MTALFRLCGTLNELGVTHVFGLPGTQNAELFNLLPGHSIRPVLATHELSASFMANGYARASGRVGVLLTIPGPGFTYALPGIAEARLDSVPLIHLVGAPAEKGGRFGHQAIDQAGIARPLVKAIVDIQTAGDVTPGLRHAHDLALAGEPGPVLVQLHPEALRGSDGQPPSQSWRREPERVAERGAAKLGDLVARVRAAERPVLLLGSGAASAAGFLADLASRLRAPVFTTLSGRGVVPEDHPSAVAFDAERGGVGALNALLDRSDLILALGCRLGHNGTAGFGLRLPAERLVHVNTDPLAPQGPYSAGLTIEASVREAVEALLAQPDPLSASGWTAAELQELKADISAPRKSSLPEPHIQGVPGGHPQDFFRALRSALPRDGIVVTDSGLHQAMTRRYSEVLAPGGLITPTDFQSMGFGLPAALGARLGAPARAVVAVVGDGGFLMSAMDLLCAVREHIPVVVVVFNDRQLNLIRLQQLRDFGRPSGVALANPDFQALAGAIRLQYSLLDGDLDSILRDALSAREPVLLEMRLTDSAGIQSLRLAGAGRRVVRQALGPGLLNHIKALVRKRRDRPR